jgi:hypothetical protein
LRAEFSTNEKTLSKDTSLPKKAPLFAELNSRMHFLQTRKEAARKRNSQPTPIERIDQSKISALQTGGWMEFLGEAVVEAEVGAFPHCHPNDSGRQAPSFSPFFTLLVERVSFQKPPERSAS